MKKMKMIAALFVMLVALVGISPVKAMSESELYNKISATYEINGSKYSLSAGDKLIAKRYLDNFEVSASHCDYIAGKIDQAVAEMRKSGVKDFTNFSKLPASLKNTLKGYVLDVAANTSVKASTKKGAIVIYNADGTVFAEITSLVKNTGSTMNVIAVVALSAAVIGAVVLFRNVKANA